MKVGFFLENKYYDNIDFSNPQGGNPGIRGTQYMFWMVAYLLSKKNIEVHLFAPNTDKMPGGILVHKCETEVDAVRMSHELSLDVIILRGIVSNLDAYNEILKYNQKCIVWSHNFESNKLADAIADNDMIKANVCVGRQQYERLIDHRVFKKSTYIYNGIDYQNYEPDNNMNKENIVMYVGSLEKGKGFYKLAKVWKKVLKKVPDAKLYVVGKGNMGSNQSVGKLGLASQYDEDCFTKYLKDKKGEIIPSVHFMGNLGGEEKINLMRKAKVGVVSTTGNGETFCIVAIEFEALGIPVVSKNKYGLLDTTKDGFTSIFAGCDRQLKNAVVELLKNDNKSYSYGKNGVDFVRRKFNFDDITTSWEQLLNLIVNGDKIVTQKPQGEFSNDYKWLRIINSKIQKVGIKTPSLLWIKDVGLCVKFKLLKMLKR